MIRNSERRWKYLINRKLRAVILFIVFPVLAAFSQQAELVSHPSGVYDREILLEIKRPERGEVYYSFEPGRDVPDVKYTGAVVLGALNGEEREYRLKIAAGGAASEYNYIIDRRPPAGPEAFWSENQEGEAGYLFKHDNDKDKIFYGYDEYKKGSIFEWKGEFLNIPVSGFIFYYAEDEAGNRSRTGILQREQVTESEVRTRLEVRSPVEGSFANTQLLYIDNTGFEWIKYSLNGLDPEKAGSEYTAPVEIRRYGNITLKIAAKYSGSDRIERREINYRVNTTAPIKNIPVSGVYSSKITIKSGLEGYRYCMEERAPGQTDGIFGGLNISPVYGGVKYVTVRLKKTEDADSSELRYFYVIDDRFPAGPVISLDSALPANGDLSVSIEGPSYSEIYYTVDGTTPTPVSPRYEEPFRLSIPKERNAGSVIIKARTVSINGKASNVVSKLITYDTEAPEVPDVRIIRNDENGAYDLICSFSEGERLYYGMTDSDGIMAPVVPDDFVLDVPDGMERDFSFVFMAEDDAGNRSGLTEPVNITVDRKPPEAAGVEIKDGMMVIESEDYVTYKIETYFNGTLLESRSGVYDGPVRLSESGEETPANRIIRIKTETADAEGNSTVDRKVFVFDEEDEGTSTFLFNSDSGDVYSGEQVVFHAYPDGPGDSLFYYLTETDEGGEEKVSGPVSTDGDIFISGYDQRRVEFLLEVYSINEKNGRKSRVSGRNFVIDNEKPGKPEIIGMPEEPVVADRVVLSPSGDDDCRIFLVVSSDEDGLPPVFSKSAVVFRRDLVFDAEIGEEKDYYLQLGAEDQAGNRTVNEEIYHFTVDRKNPEVRVELAGQGTEGDFITITASPDAGEELRYYYETGSRGAVVNIPDEDSGFFTDELVIRKTAGLSEQKIIKIRSCDQAGNLSSGSLSFLLNLDKKAPAAPGKPVTDIVREYRKIFLSWPEAGDGEAVYYRIEDRSEDYSEYTAPVSVKMKAGENKIKISYYAADEAGNRSRSQELTVWVPDSEFEELVQGIKNGSFYNRDLELEKADGRSLIRYEIRTNEIIAPKVTVFSPELPGTLNFKVEEGESLSFIVSLKEFKDEHDLVGGAEQVLRFSIDKQSPRPPSVEGIMNDEYYLTDRSIYFTSPEGEIYYRIMRTGKTYADWQKYTKPVDIVSDEGTYQSFEITAYSQDFAGNRSVERNWTITIDKEIIYVSPDGFDYSDGTRSRPFRSINKAVDQLKKSRRKTIFIASGQYEINSPIVIDEEFSVHGGFNAGWAGRDGETEITAGESFKEGEPVFYIYGGKLNLTGVDITADNGRNDSLFYINKGDLNLSGCKITAGCGTGSGIINQNYGNLIISNSELTGSASECPVISSDYGLVNINNSTITAGADDGDLVLIEVKNSIKTSINGSEINPVSGDNITGLKISNSSVELKNNELRSGAAGISSNIIEIVNSKLRMNYCRLDCSEQNRISGAIVSEDSVLDIKANNFRVKAEYGQIGFKITGGESAIINNRIISGECRDFSYLFYLTDGKHVIDTNIIKNSRADDTVFMKTSGANIDLLQNTVEITGEKGRLTAISPDDGSVCRIINNIIVNRQAEKKSILLRVVDDSLVSVKNNCLSGWEYYCKGKKEAKDLLSMDLLDGIYSAGHFAGNIEFNAPEGFEIETDYHLEPKSECIDSGYDLSEILKTGTDFDGEKRPNPLLGRDPAFDIGADEYYD